MNEVLEVMVMMMLVFLESLSPSLDENFGVVAECLEVVMMMVVVFLERHKVATDSNLPKSKLVVAGSKPWNTERGRASICFYGSLLCALHVF